MSELSAFAAQISHNVSIWASSWMRRPVPPSIDNQPLNHRERNGNDLHSDDDVVNPEDPDRVDPEVQRENSEIISNAMLVGKEMSILKRLTNRKHRQATKLWSKLCHKIDVSYPPKEELHPIDLPDDEMKDSNQNTIPHPHPNALLRDEMRYCLRHAFTAYQPAFVALKSEEISLAFKSLTTMLMACFHLSADDILVDHCSPKLDRLYTKTHEPAFYLAVDHNECKIILSIRGTSSIGDIITDLNMKSIQFSIYGTTGYVHEGFLQSAQFIHKSVTNTLIDTCNQYGDYQVVITGHSLGAGVAALLGLMYRDNTVIRGRDGLRLKVWCFASPCIVSRDFTDRQLGDDYITSVVLETDVVTRLSTESVGKSNLRQDFIMAQNAEMIEDVLRRDQLDAESEGAEFLRILKTLESPKPEEQLFALGRMLWFVPRIVMDDDIAFRRRTLMKMLGDHCNGDDESNEVEMCRMTEDLQFEEEQEEGMESSGDDGNGKCGEEIEGKEDNDNDSDQSVEWKKRWSDSMQDLYANIEEGLMIRRSQSVSACQVFREVCHDISRGVKDLQTDIRCKMDSSKRRRKYSGRNYVLCDATQCRYIFQEFMFDFPDSIKCHNPQRYLWACDATLRE